MFEFYRYTLLFNIIFRVVIKFFPRIMWYFDYANLIVLSVLHRFVKEKHLRILVIIATVAGALLYCLSFYFLSSGDYIYISMFND